VPIALAIGIHVGFGIVLPRGGSAITALLHILPADDTTLARALVTSLTVAAFTTAIACALAIPSALALRRWIDTELGRPVGEVSTLKGLGPELIPTQIVTPPGVPPPNRRPFVIVGAAVVVLGGVIAIAALSGGTTAKRPGAMTITAPRDATVAVGSVAVATPTRGTTPEPVAPDAGAVALDAGSVIPAEPDAGPRVDVVPAPEDFVSAWHAALATLDDAALEPLVDEHAFALGIDAHALADGRTAVVAQLRRELGTPPPHGFEVSARFSSLGRQDDLAWLAEELRIGSRTFVITAALGLRDLHWQIAAVHVAMAMANEQAYRTARDGSLAAPDAIPDDHDASTLAAVMREAFASKPSFVAARSTRPDGFNFGSAPGERIAGGEAVAKTFARLRATIHLHDAVKVGAIGEHGGWGAANVDFTDADRDGTQVTQTFRVLVVWLREQPGWRIVQTQWSNPR
jgi:hypothetical protein